MNVMYYVTLRKSDCYSEIWLKLIICNLRFSNKLLIETRCNALIKDKISYEMEVLNISIYKHVAR